MSKSSSDETLSTSESPSYASMYSGDQTNCSWQRIVLAPLGIMFYALAYVPFCWALLLQSSVTRSPVLPEQAVTQATADTLYRRRRCRPRRPRRRRRLGLRWHARRRAHVCRAVSQWDIRISPLSWAAGLFLFSAVLAYCIGAPFVFEAEAWFQKNYILPLAVLNFFCMLMTLDYGKPQAHAWHLEADADRCICTATRRRELRTVKPCRSTNSRLCCWQRPFRPPPPPPPTHTHTHTRARARTHTRTHTPPMHQSHRACSTRKLQCSVAQVGLVYSHRFGNWRNWLAISFVVLEHLQVHGPTHPPGDSLHNTRM